MSNNFKFFILTGDPGVGKTTLIKKLCSLLNENGVKTIGFYTEEVRRNRSREGFDIVTLSGVRGRLARDQTLLLTPNKFTVGKYGVLVQEFENIAMASLKKPYCQVDIMYCNTETDEIDDINIEFKTEDKEALIMVIDEIGKMEFYSSTFKLKVKEIFSPESNCLILATIPARKSDPLIESIRNNRLSKVWTVTRENRNLIHEDILNHLNFSIKT